jgi:Flp pilus assembly pilin Flp
MRLVYTLFKPTHSVFINATFIFRHLHALSGAIFMNTHRNARWKNLAGQGLIEYAIILALVGAALVVVMPELNQAIQGTFENVVQSMANPPAYQPIDWDYSGSGGTGGTGGTGHRRHPAARVAQAILAGPAARVIPAAQVILAIPAAQVIPAIRVIPAGPVALAARVIPAGPVTQAAAQAAATTSARWAWKTPRPARRTAPQS